MCHKERLPAGWLIAVILLGGGGAGHVFAQSPVVLEQGSESERALHGGEAHEYQVSLLAGQFLYAVVDQEGVDVAVTLYAPNGQKVTKVDSMNEEYGPEPVVAIAETSGLHRIVVASENKDSLPGRYKIRVAEVRTPKPGDQEHIAAERDIERARDLKSTHDGKDWDTAIAKLQEALAYYQAEGAQDTYRHGLVLFSIGYLQAQKSRVRESIGAYEAALPLFQAAGDSIMEARVRNNLGGEYYDLGDPVKALQYHQEALSMLPAGQASKVEIAAENNLGVLYEEMGSWTAALDAYEKAAPGFASQGYWRELAIAWSNIAKVYLELNEPDQSLRYLEQALQLMRRKSVYDPSLQAEILTNRAEVLFSQGQFAEAIEWARQALSLRRVAGDRRREGDTLSVMGFIYQSMHEPDMARRVFQDAIGKQQEAGYQFGIFQNLLGLGNLDLSLRQTEQARQQVQQALEIAAALGCGECNIQAEFLLARIQRELGHSSESMQQIKAAAGNIEALRAGIGPPALRTSFLGRHEPVYEFYIDASLHDPASASPEIHSAVAFQISEHARARSLLEALSGMRTDLSREDDSELAEHEHEVQRELALNAGELLMRWQGERAGGSLHSRKDVEARIEQLEAEFNAIEIERAKKNRSYAGLTQPQYLTVQAVQDLLDDQTLFLEYYLGDRKSYLWAITSDAVLSYELPPRARIEAVCREVYELVKRHSHRNSALISATSELSSLVLGPVAEKLGTKRLVIAADGALQYIPFAALNQPGVRGEYIPLMLAHEIVNVPSASAVAAQRELVAHRQPAPLSLAIFADPVFSARDPRLLSRPASPVRDLPWTSAARLLEHVQDGSSIKSIPRLPFTAVEADSIAALTPADVSMKAVGFDATRALATSAGVGQYKYLHFATHGYIDSRHPELSALVLSLLDKDGNSQDGFLRLQDIYNLRLHADLVVLSACETGLGREIRGEGLISLTRGFMYAGAARVLVSLWDVSDQGTSALMSAFYKRMLQQGKTPAAALRAAQIAMFRDPRWQAPYYWAPFTLNGEWE